MCPLSLASNRIWAKLIILLPTPAFTHQIMPVLPPKCFWKVISNLYSCDHFSSPLNLVHLFWIFHLNLTQSSFLSSCLLPQFSAYYFWEGLGFPGSVEGWLDVCGQKSSTRLFSLITCFLQPRSAAQVLAWRWQRLRVGLCLTSMMGGGMGEVYIHEVGLKWWVMESKLGKEGSKSMWGYGRELL